MSAILKEHPRTLPGGLVKVENLNKFFGSHQVLTDIHLTITPSQRVVLCGPSGSGKSTLARCISGLEPYQSGKVEVNGTVIHPDTQHIHRIGANIGMVFQQFNLFPHLTVLENCILAQQWVRKRPKKEAIEIAMMHLSRVRMDAKASAYPSKLSGGQQQRVAIARALCLDPSVMLFDEATSALDPEMVQEVLDTMISLASSGMTMVCITHEMGFAKAVADRVVFMENGHIVQDAKTDEFFGPHADERIQKFLQKTF